MSYLKNGTITIDSVEGEKQLTIIVADNGVGMSTEILKKIFSNSDHYSTYGTSNERGTGLGLVLCKEMIDKNNGNLTVESEPGKGSVFKVSLPSIH